MSLRKKILFVQTRSGGGSVVALHDMIQVLDKTRFEPVIFCYEENAYTQVLRNLNITIHYHKNRNETVSELSNSGNNIKIPIRMIRQLKRLLLNDVRMAKHIKKILVDEKIDLVHHNTDFPYIRQGLIANRKIGIPQVCHYRSFKDYKKGSFDWWVDRYFVKKVHHHIYISNAVQSHFEKWLKVNPAKGCMVRDIIDVKKFIPGISGEKVKKDLGIESDQMVITNIGRIIHWKGQHVFIEAFKKVILKYPNSIALIVGPYDEGIGNNQYYEDLLAQADDLKLRDSIIFTGNRNDVPEIIAMSNCIVHSSVSPEPQGLVIVEALFSKKPVVVTDAGGAAELIVNNEGGLKVPANDAETMANAICKLLEMKENIANAPSPAILKQFHPPTQIKVIEDIYDRLLQV